MGGMMSGSEARPEAAREFVRSLVAEKVRFLVPMTVAFMTSYIGLTVLAGFAKDLMALKVVGSLNLGFTLIGLNYLMSWVLALVYERIANNKFDPLASAAAKQASIRRSNP
jgi:uncharacterized membrane protein (DUF485 family)